ncbi:MAG: DUF1501 domain-containing protein [Acidobacteriota bacterium]|nr:DUF1501 domain-containing protein [Acidobacteriota bacterium]
MALTRRQFIGRCIAAPTALALAPVAGYGRGRFKPVTHPGRIAKTLGSARNLIFIHLRGGPSQIDTFDLKRGLWTPDRLGPQLIGGALDWPAGVMPKLAGMTDRFSLLRGLTAAEAVHERANYHLLTSYRKNPSTTADIPNFMALLSLLLEDTRNSEDVMPFAVAVSRPEVGNGKLGVEYALSRIQADGSLPNLNHPWEQPDQRFEMLTQMAEKETTQARDPRAAYQQILETTRRMSRDERLLDYNQTGGMAVNGNFYNRWFMTQAAAAVRILSADLGTRMVFLDFFGWDHHFNIYQNTGGDLFTLSGAFDNAAAYLIDTLGNLPGQSGSLLDDTLIVAVGEFGRTVGAVDGNGGRDHYPYVLPALVTGGGCKTGRVIGASDDKGSYVADRGWSRNRDMLIGDLLATIFSAMGADWQSRIQYTPTGRVYDAVDTRLTGPLYPIEELFT